MKWLSTDFVAREKVSSKIGVYTLDITCCGEADIEKIVDEVCKQIQFVLQTTTISDTSPFLFSAILCMYLEYHTKEKGKYHGRE